MFKQSAQQHDQKLKQELNNLEHILTDLMLESLSHTHKTPIHKTPIHKTNTRENNQHIPSVTRDNFIHRQFMIPEIFGGNKPSDEELIRITEHIKRCFKVPPMLEKPEILLQRINGSNIILYNCRELNEKSKETELDNLQKEYPDKIFIEWQLSSIIPKYEKFATITNEQIITELYKLTQLITKTQKIIRDRLIESEKIANDNKSRVSAEFKKLIEQMQSSNTDFLSKVEMPEVLKEVDKYIDKSIVQLTALSNLKKAVDSIESMEQHLNNLDEKHLSRTTDMLINVRKTFRDYVRKFLIAYQIDQNHIDLSDESDENIFNSFNNLLANDKNNKSDETDKVVETRKSEPVMSIRAESIDPTNSVEPFGSFSVDSTFPTDSTNSTELNKYDIKNFNVKDIKDLLEGKIELSDSDESDDTLPDLVDENGNQIVG